jgi:CHASE3 domain sensor protein
MKKAIFILVVLFSAVVVFWQLSKTKETYEQIILTRTAFLPAFITM